MGLPDIYSVTVEGAKNFRAAIESEERASWAWMGKWGWILDEYKTINRELAQLKEGRKFKEEVREIEDNRTTRPFSETEGHEYGFLAEKPEFRLEIFSSPGLTALPKSLPPALFYKLLDERMEEKQKIFDKPRIALFKTFFGRMNQTSVSADRAYREYLVAEERAAWLWGRNWGWIIDEYRMIYEKLKALKSEKAKLVHTTEGEEDKRTTRPFPETTAHEYGHLSTNPEFVLEKFSSTGLTPLKKSLTTGELYHALDERFTRRFASTEHHGFLNYYKVTPKRKVDGIERFGLNRL